MEGTAGNFASLLSDFVPRLSSADFVAMDLEMTGVGAGRDSLFDPVEVKYQHVREAAQRFSICQVGITLGCWGEGSIMALASYNIFVFPFCKEREVNPSITCASTGVKFLSRNGFDFNRWIRDGVPFRATAPQDSVSIDTDQVDFSRLWHALCAAQKPLVLHSGLTDLAYMMSCFEFGGQMPPDASDFQAAIRRLSPQVFDTAHLHTAVGATVGKFKRLGLAKFLGEAEQRVEGRVNFVLEGDDTKSRYGTGGQAHEAGFDSLMTAKLFACLRLLAPETVAAEANRLFLWMSTECVDISSSFVGRLSYYGGCAAFLLDFPEGDEDSLGRLKDLWRHGGQSELRGASQALVLWPRAEALLGPQAPGHGHLDATGAPSWVVPAATWTPLAMPPRLPEPAPRRRPASDPVRSGVRSSGARSATTVARKRPAAASPGPRKKPAGAQARGRRS